MATSLGPIDATSSGQVVAIFMWVEHLLGQTLEQSDFDVVRWWPAVLRVLFINCVSNLLWRSV